LALRVRWKGCVVEATVGVDLWVSAQADVCRCKPGVVEVTCGRSAFGRAF